MNQTVSPSGPLDCSICIIGECPSIEDLSKGRPFSDKAGKLLDQWLSLLGLNREKCYTTTVLKESATKYNSCESRTRSIKGIKTTVVDTTERYDCQESDLWVELAQCTANVFIPLDNISLYALTRRWGINKFRGSILECNAPGLEGRKVIPTLHPSASFKQPITRVLTLHDLGKAKREQSTPTLQRPPRNLVLNPFFEEALGWLESCQEFTEVGFDIETTVEKRGSSKFVKEMFMFSVALPTNPITSVVVSLINADGTPRWTPSQECDLMEALARLLTDPRVLKVGQNLIFDSTVLYERYGIQCWPVGDTMVAHRIAFPEFPADLGHITSMYTDEPYYKDTGGKFFDGKAVGWEDFLRYSAMDSVICLEAMPQLKTDLVKQGNTGVYETHIACHRPILYMQAHGYAVDVEAKDTLKKEYMREIKAQQAALEALITKPYGPKAQKEKLNVKSVTQLKAFFTDLGVKLPSSHGKTTTDKKAIAKLVAKGIPEARLIQSIKQLRDDLSKYWACRLSPEGRMCSAYSPHGTKGGRFSASQTIWGHGSQGQNRPPKFKKVLRPDPGYLPIVVDLSQAENRNTAYLARETRMIAAFESGQDVHRLTAGLLFGKDPSEISNEKGSSKLGGGAYSERFWGKKANHSLNYDIGPNEFSEVNEIPLNESKWIIAAYHRAYPNVRSVFQADVKAELWATRTLHNLRGRSIRIYNPLDDRVFKFGYAWKNQSTVSDIINPQGLIPLYENQELYGKFEIVNQIHDSLEFQILVASEDDLVYCAKGLQSLVASLEVPLVAHGRTFTIPAEVEVGSFAEGVKVDVKGSVDEVASRLEKVWAAL